ncbi:MAG: MBL fold metallo-hydrolase RNA specificity domain-containing protein, partial [Bacteroidota bacterium]
LTDNIRLKFHNAGHILGAAWVELNIRGQSQQKTLVFSGDLGRYNQPVLRDPVSMTQTDVLLVESTYGDRENLSEDPTEEFAEVVNEAMDQGGCLLIPAFAVGRTQTVMYYLKTLMEAGKIPKVPVYLDSPMAINVTQLYKRHFTYHKLRDQDLKYSESIFDYEFFNYYRSVPASQSINEIRKNAIIVSSSGMCTGGRVLHHLVRRLDRPEDTILFVGYQAKGTRGRRILDQEETIRIFGQNVPLKMQVRRIDGLSAHADKSELLRWVNTLKEHPKRTFLVHGEIDSAEAMQQSLLDAGWANVHVPDYQEIHTLFKGI